MKEYEAKVSGGILRLYRRNDPNNRAPVTSEYATDHEVLVCEAALNAHAGNFVDHDMRGPCSCGVCQECNWAMLNET